MNRKQALPRSADCCRSEVVADDPASGPASGPGAGRDDRELITQAAWRLGRRQAGREDAAGPKEAISIRIDRDVLEWFRTNSDHYQTRINALLRAFVDEAKNRKRAG